MDTKRKYNSFYSGDSLKHIAYPLGGLGAGMVCIQGNGSLGNFAVRNSPNVMWEPDIFAAVCIKGEKNKARVLEGPTPMYKIFDGPITGQGNGLFGKNYGLPRFGDCSFESRFPFAKVELQEDEMPINVEIEAFSPFTPNDADNSSLPFAGLQYIFNNASDNHVDAVFYFNSFNFMSTNENAYTDRIANGFLLCQPGTGNEPWQEGYFCAFTDEAAEVNTAWFRGGWFDTLTMLWKDIENGVSEDRTYTDSGKSEGSSLSVRFSLEPGETKKIKLSLCWYVPETNIRFGHDFEKDNGSCCQSNCCCGGSKTDTLPKHKPWYSNKFTSIFELKDYISDNYDMLYFESKKFSNCLYDTTLPDEVMEAVTANLSILKSPTILRQTDGRLWCWEGCCDTEGCCAGTCTHVWNYAQALCNLFPELERGLRQTEFFESQDERGHQQFRASLPIRETTHDFHAAADGQLGGIIKIYREWRISGNTEWLKEIWPKVKLSLNYCIETWDKKREGVLKEPHHNTYDIEFWGADSMCSSFYIGALKAAGIMAKALGDDDTQYMELYERGRKYLEEKLYNGEYFYQQAEWETLEADFESVLADEKPEAVELIKQEGPKYQYKNGCLSDGLIGAWLAKICGLGDVLDTEKIKSHLFSVHKHNFKTDLSGHANPQRPGYAVGSEGGLLLCTWPYGGKPSLPFVYSDEVWTGIEYQVASHLILMGYVHEGLQIVRAARDRYSGIVRNPYNEYECGHWYARALASYALIQAMTGIFYDAVDKTLYISPAIKGDFKSFLSTQTGYATVGIKNELPFINVISGDIEVRNIICK